MNKIQWFVLNIGLIIFGSFMLGMSILPSCNILTSSGDMLVACYIRQYAYAIPGLISLALGMIFFILGLLEPKDKELEGWQKINYLEHKGIFDKLDKIIKKK